MSAPTSRSRTRRRRWRCRSRTIARARSAPPTRSGYDDGRLHSTNTDVEGFTANLDAAVPGWDSAPDEAVVLGAGGSARAVVYGLIERGFGASTWSTARRSVPQALRARFGAAVQPAHWSRAAASARPRRAPGQHHLARHDRPAAARHRSRAAAAPMPWSPTWSMRRWKRRCWRPPAPAASPPPTGSACCCIRRCGASSCGSACARR